MIELEKIRFKNINAVGNYVVEIPLNAYKNLIIVGNNGSGKSTILQALSFGLFGKPFSSVKIGSIINSINNKNLLVEIYFKNGKNKYIVNRGLKPDIFEIYENDVLLKQSSKKADYQKTLETILGFDFKTFINVIVLGSATNIPFMQLPTKDRRELIEKLLDLEVFSYMNDFSKKELKSINEKIKDIETSIYKTELNLENKQQFKTDFLTKINSNISELLDKIKEKEIEINELEAQKTIYEEKINSVVLEKYINSLEKLEFNLKEVEMEIVSINVANKETKKKIDFIALNNDCPTCGQSLSDAYKKNIKKTASILEDFKQKEEKINISEKIEKIKDFLKRFEDVKRKISELEGNIKINNKEIIFYNNEIKKLNEQDSIDYDIEISKLKKTIEELKKNKDALNEEKLIADVALLLLKDDGIKASIINKYVGIINELINFYLEKFDFFVKFELNEQFEESFKSRHLDKFSYLNFSEGEKKRIDLAILLALKEISKRKNMVSCNLLCFDETIERIDVAAADCFSNILKDSKTNNIIISHNENIISKFTSSEDYILRVYKKGNFSYYEKN